MKHIFNVHARDVFFAASDIGWVVGHSFIVYGPLIRGASSIIYEGKPIMTPDPGALWRVISTYKAHTLYAAPTAIRILKKEDYDGKYINKYDFSNLNSVHLVGERCDPDTINWIHKMLP
jgi:propionyl-CoA synthetase